MGLRNIFHNGGIGVVLHNFVGERIHQKLHITVMNCQYKVLERLMAIGITVFFIAGFYMRRFTRLTNGHSKKIENHCHAISLYFMHYNYCKIHSTLRVTPAMEASLTDHVWEPEELLALIE